MFRFCVHKSSACQEKQTDFQSAQTKGSSPPDSTPKRCNTLYLACKTCKKGQRNFLSFYNVGAFIERPRATRHLWLSPLQNCFLWQVKPAFWKVPLGSSFVVSFGVQLYPLLTIWIRRQKKSSNALRSRSSLAVPLGRIACNRVPFSVCCREKDVNAGCERNGKSVSWERGSGALCLRSGRGSKEI